MPGALLAQDLLLGCSHQLYLDIVDRGLHASWAQISGDSGQTGLSCPLLSLKGMGGHTGRDLASRVRHSQRGTLLHTLCQIPPFAGGCRRWTSMQLLLSHILLQQQWGHDVDDLSLGDHLFTGTHLHTYYVTRLRRSAASLCESWSRSASLERYCRLTGLTFAATQSAATTTCCCCCLQFWFGGCTAGQSAFLPCSPFSQLPTTRLPALSLK